MLDNCHQSCRLYLGAADAEQTQCSTGGQQLQPGVQGAEPAALDF